MYKVLHSTYSSRVCVMCVMTSALWMHQPGSHSTQGKGHTEFLHLPYAVLAFIFTARRIRPLLSPFNREVGFVYPRVYRSPRVGHDLI